MTGSRLRGARMALACLRLCHARRLRPDGRSAARGNGPYYNRPDSPAPPGPPGDPWGPWIRDASRRFDVPERWIREVMRQESGGRANATSPRRRHGPDAGDARAPIGNCRRATTSAPTPTTRMTASRPARPICARCTSCTATRPSWRPTMPARAGSRTTCGAAAACRTKRATTSQRIGPRIQTAAPNRRAPAEVYAAAEIGLTIPPGPRPMGGGTMMALRQQREAAPPVQVAAAPPPPPAAPRVQVASLATAALVAPPPPAPPPAAHLHAGHREPDPDALAPAPPWPRRPANPRSSAAQQADEDAAQTRTPAVVAARPGRAGAPRAGRLALPQPGRDRRHGAGQHPARAPPPAAAPAPRPAAAAAAGGNRWSVQVGAFALREPGADHGEPGARRRADHGHAHGGHAGPAGQHHAVPRARHRPVAQRRRAGLRADARPRAACTVVAPGA